MSTTAEETVTAPPPTVREPGMVEQIQGLGETVRRVVAERDAARLRVTQLTEEVDAAHRRAERAESYAVALDNQVRARDAEIRDLRTRLADARKALAAATADSQAPRSADTAPAPPSIPDAPQRPVRRRSWRRPPRRH